MDGNETIHGWARVSGSEVTYKRKNKKEIKFKTSIIATLRLHLVSMLSLMNQLTKKADAKY